MPMIDWGSTYGSETIMGTKENAQSQIYREF